jgi:hypothetical protein
MLLLLMALLSPAGIMTHPMHTAVAEISCVAGSGTAEIRIRVFADDLDAALGEGSKMPADSAISRYVRGRFALADRAGHPLPLQWVGAEHEGDVVVLYLRVTSALGLAKGKVLSAILAERFEDQVNIVRASYDGSTTTLLFIRGDFAKPLP